MNYDKKEEKMIQYLREEIKVWRKGGRIFVLVTGLFIALGSIGIIFKIKEIITLIPEASNMVLPVIPITLVFSVFAGFLLSNSILQWHGDPVKILLLKLIESKEEMKH